MKNDDQEFLSIQRMLKLTGHMQEFCDPQDSLSALISSQGGSSLGGGRDSESEFLSDDELSDVAGGTVSDYSLNKLLGDRDA